MSTAHTALEGIRVLDFTRVLAGPFCTMTLADLGADVIKVESLQGDDTRTWGPPWFTGAGGERESAYYLSANRNKRSLALNLKSPEGQAIAQQLAAQSQVVVENFKPGAMNTFGLGYNSLHALNPALVYASITGYGQSGPYADHPGYDFAIQAQSGLMSITGPVEGEPYKIGVAITDVIAGLFAATSILAALRHAEATGEGQHLDIALLDTTLAALVNVASSALVSGEPPLRYGNAHPSIVPYQLFQAADKSFALAVGNDRQFAQLCALIQRPDLYNDPRYATNPARVVHRDALIAELNAIFATRPAAEWVSHLLTLGIPAAPLNDIPTILKDPHVQERGLIQEVDLWGETLRVMGMPVHFSQTPPTTRTPPPALGQHTDAILGELLHLSGSDIAQLREKGVIG